MTEENTGLQVQNKTNSPGDNLVDLGIVGMDGAEVLTLVSPIQRDTSLINDNYCASPAVVNQVKVWRDSNMQKQTVQLVVQDSLRGCKVVKVASSNKFQRHSKQAVSCLVANPVPTVILEGHP